MKKANIFKCKITYLPDGKAKVISYANQQIPLQLLKVLNESVHRVIEKWNDDAPWKKEYIRFEHKGVHYIQVDNENNNDACENCAFHNKKSGNLILCNHPFRETKGDCDNKHYIIEK